MFASHEVRLNLTFARARARLAVLCNAGWLSGPSEQAYAEGLAGLTRVGPFGAVARRVQAGPGAVAGAGATG